MGLGQGSDLEINMIKVFIIVGMFAVSASTGPTRADPLYEGRYRVAGKMPHEQAHYEGVAQIKKTGDTYTVLWRVNNVIYFGTGVRRGDVLSVVFLPLNAKAKPGIASLSIEHDQVTKGTWTVIGTRITVAETWLPIVDSY